MTNRKKSAITETAWIGPLWTGARPRKHSRLFGTNPLLNAALFDLPGFREAEDAVRRFAARHDAMLQQFGATPTATLAEQIADRYRSSSDGDLTAALSTLADADDEARKRLALIESHLAAGEILLDRREAVVADPDNQARIAAYLKAQLVDAIERARREGVTGETATIAGNVNRDDLADVRALNEAVKTFDLVRAATSDLLAGVEYATSDAPTIALVRVIGNATEVDPLWPVTARAGRAATSITDGTTISTPVIPDFQSGDSAALVAWMAEHPEAEIRVPTRTQVKVEVARLVAAKQTVANFASVDVPRDAAIGLAKDKVWTASDGSRWTVSSTEGLAVTSTYRTGAAARL